MFKIIFIFFSNSKVEMMQLDFSVLQHVLILELCFMGKT